MYINYKGIQIPECSSYTVFLWQRGSNYSPHRGDFCSAAQLEFRLFPVTFQHESWNPWDNVEVSGPTTKHRNKKTHSKKTCLFWSTVPFFWWLVFFFCSAGTFNLNSMFFEVVWCWSALRVWIGSCKIPRRGPDLAARNSHENAGSGQNVVLRWPMTSQTQKKKRPQITWNMKPWDENKGRS